MQFSRLEFTTLNHYTKQVAWRGGAASRMRNPSQITSSPFCMNESSSKNNTEVEGCENSFHKLILFIKARGPTHFTYF